MARKHSPGCYCCGCEEIDVATLPEITIAGYTQQGTWGGSECCKCLRFTPDQPQTSCNVSSVMATHEMTFTLAWQELGRENRLPRVVIDEAVPDPIPEEYCCNGAIFAVASHDLEIKQKASYRLKSLVTPESIDVCIYRLEVTCGESEPALKWIVLSRFNYNAEVYITPDLYHKVTKTSTKLGGDCFYLPSGVTTCGIACEESRLVGCDNEDPDPVTACGNLGGSGTVSFTRVKLYDELPTGEITFTNNDTPEECTWSFCENPTEYFNSYCWEVTSNSDCLTNCMCLETLVDEPTQSYTDLNSPQCCNFCFFQQLGSEWTSYSSGACDAPAILCYPCPEHTCPTYTGARLKEKIIQEPSQEECNGDYELDLQLWNSWFYGSLYDLCLDSFQNIRNPILLSNCYITGCNEACEGDCCIKYECDNELLFCYKKYDGAGVNVTDLSLIWDCDIIGGQSFCLNAPQWTIEFS